MESNIRAGMRVLYKQGNSNWMIGTIMRGSAEINEQGLWIPILPKDTNEEVHYAAISQIFFDATELDNWMKDRLIPKADYIEYYYYPISKFNEIWINKQPFNFVIRSD